MGIRIEQINIEELGPLSRLTLEPGSLNLIYGRNEQGKTLLVEFLIRALFRHVDSWRLRPANGRGQIMVSGLDERPISFTATTARQAHKLEDYLTAQNRLLPAALSRLLVIRSGESSLIGDRQALGVNRDVLSRYLSGQNILDAIEGKIQKTVQQAEIGRGEIHGRNQGQLKQRAELQEEKERLDALFTALNDVYSGGPRQELQQELRRIEQEIAGQETARRYEAHALAAQIEQIEQARQPQAARDKLRSDWQRYQEQQAAIARERERLADLAEQSRHYEWLEEAAAIYERLPAAANANPLYLGLVIAALLLAVLFSFWQLAPLTALMVLLALLPGWLYIRQMQRSAAQAAQSVERDKLAAEFQRRFGRPLSGLPHLQEEKKKAAAAYAAAQERRQALAGATAELARLERELIAERLALGLEASEPAQWPALIPAWLAEQRKLEERYSRLRERLAALGVEPAEYESEGNGVAYDPALLNRLQAERQETAELLRAEEEKLNHLKQWMCQETGDDISVDWESLIGRLQERRSVKVADYQAVTAEILTGVILSDLIAEARQAEDEQMERNFEAAAVAKTIYQVTNRYRRARLADDALWLDDGYGEFNLADLSQGAQEQILLALRLGFAARLLQEQTLFLILDDAFQRSDWQRRERLVERMVVLSEQGWQVLYFTMDDHLRDLFDERGRRLGEHYCSFYL